LNTKLSINKKFPNESSNIFRKKSAFDKSNLKKSILPFREKKNKLDKTLETHINSYEELFLSERKNHD
jgi:hypothetical protein